MGSPRFTPLRVAVAYIGGGLVLFVFPEIVFLEPVRNGPVLAHPVWELAELGVTGAFVLFVLHARERRLERTRDERDEANRLLGILYRVLRHDLRNDTNVIRGYTNVLRDRSDDPRDVNALARIDEAVNDIINYSTKLQRIAATDTKRTTVELPRVISDVAEDLRSTYPDARITTEFEGMGRVLATPDIDQAIAEVVENAVLHSDAVTPTVSIELVDDEDSWRVTVTDNGPGIPDHEREALRRGTETPHVHSSGIGLWFVFWVVTHSNGRVEIDDNNPRGSVVTLVLPKVRTGPSPTDRRLNRLFRRRSSRFGGTEHERDTTAPQGDRQARVTDGPREGRPNILIDRPTNVPTDRNP